MDVAQQRKRSLSSMSSSFYVTRTTTEVVSEDSISVKFSDAPLHKYDDPTFEFIDDDSKSKLQSAAGALKDGEVVAFPTETVYGLGADATNDEAVKRIYRAKSRPSDNPLITHVASLKQLRTLLADADGTEGTIPEVYAPLIEKYWPGPLTIILEKPSNPQLRLSPYVTAEQSTFAVRMPDSKIAQVLCYLSDKPLAAPSANSSSKPSPTLACHVLQDLKGKIPLIIDGGACDVGLESTVINGLTNPPSILRPGGISREQIKACGGVWENVLVGVSEKDFEKGVPQAPGMKYKHYSPIAPVILHTYLAKMPRPEDLIRKARGGKVGVLRTKNWPAGFADAVHNTPGGEDLVILERSLGDKGPDIQRNLFAELRQFDLDGVNVIFVEGVKEEDEGLAIMNRLRKAASVLVREWPKREYS
jgi:L-threonylcarbamoyladenylate synthase